MEMSSSLSRLCTTSSYGTRSGVLSCGRRASWGKGKRASCLAQAAAKEQASQTENSSAESSQVSDPSSRSARGFGPRPPPPPPKPPKPTPSSFTKDKKSATSRRPAPAQPVVVPVADPVARERENVFILCLSGVGVFIFIEGIAVAASEGTYYAGCLSMIPSSARHAMDQWREPIFSIFSTIASITLWFLARRVGCFCCEVCVPSIYTYSWLVFSWGCVVWCVQTNTRGQGIRHIKLIFDFVKW